jgi:hypothetical protein
VLGSVGTLNLEHFITDSSTPRLTVSKIVGH